MRTETIAPDCPFCEQPLDGPIVNGLHDNCNGQLLEELARWEESVKYSGVLNCQDSEGHISTIGDFKDVEAEDKTEAKRIVLDEFWDQRLDSASCVPVFVFTE